MLGRMKVAEETIARGAYHLRLPVAAEVEVARGIVVTSDVTTTEFVLVDLLLVGQGPGPALAQGIETEISIHMLRQVAIVVDTLNIVIAMANDLVI